MNRFKSLCAACDGLVGKPAEVDPHDHLRTQSGHRLPYGWREAYVCHICDAGLNRVSVDSGREGQGHPWSQYR